MDKSPIVEYGTCPDYHYVDGKYVCDWRSMVTVNLRWISSVVPYRYVSDDPSGAYITMCGGGGHAINVVYEDFVRDWLRVKGV